MEWSYASAVDLAAALRAGDVTSIELTEDAIARIERDDPEINAVCVPDFDRARAAAREADAALARGDDRPLLGIPMTVKESYNVAGLPTSWGIPAFKDHYPTEDAVQVARVKAAGAVVLGKTNVPEGLQGIQTFNDLHGTTNNPWDLSRTPGGSSGGSAAALAAGFGALSLGSDIGGSLRTPAHFCGVYAHKPTVALLANRGMVPPGAPALPVEPDLAVVGPMARTARDLTLLFDVMAGPDPLTSGKAYELALPPPRHESLRDFRVLVVDEHPIIPTGAAVLAAVARVADALTAAGARVDRHSDLLPDLTEAAHVYARLMFAGVGARGPAEALEHFQALVAAIDPADQSLSATRTRAIVSTYRDWSQAGDRRELHRHGWRQLFAEYDVVLAPITPTPAFPHDPNPDLLGAQQAIDGVEYPYLDQLVWAGVATMPGLPATAIPADRTPAGLPVGVQLIGPMYEDRTPLRLAELLGDAIGGFARTPG